MARDHAACVHESAWLSPHAPYGCDTLPPIVVGISRVLLVIQQFNSSFYAHSRQRAC